MPASAEKETKKGSFLKDARNAAIVTILLLAFVRGHDIRTQEEQNRSTPDIIPASTPNTCTTPEPLHKQKGTVVIYQNTSPGQK